MPANFMIRVEEEALYLASYTDSWIEYFPHPSTGEKKAAIKYAAFLRSRELFIRPALHPAGILKWKSESTCLLRNGRLKSASCRPKWTWRDIVWGCASLPAAREHRQIDCAVSELRWSILMMGRETNSGKCSAGGATADWRVMNPHQLAHRRRSVITLPHFTLPANSILDPARPRSLQFTRAHARSLFVF